MALYTEKSFEEAHNPLINYGGDDAFVKGQIYSMGNGGDMYKYANNLKSYSKALEDAKANDNDNFLTGIGDFLVGRGADKTRADLADQYVSAFSSNPYEFSGEDYNRDAGNIKTEQDFEKGRAFNGGLIGSLINPITQVGKAGADLAAGVSGNWDAWNKRDHLSDVGALGETALMFATPASLGAKTIGGTIAKNAALGAGFGLTGGLADMGSKDFNAGELALNTALGAGVGGALGGALQGGSRLWNKYSSPAPSTSTAIIPYAGGANSTTPAYQNALKTLGIDGSGLTSQGLRNARTQATKNIANTVGYETAEGQAQRTAVNNAYQTLLDSLNGKGVTATASTLPNRSFGEKLRTFGSNVPQMGRDLANTKAGTKISNLMKTKKGKIGAGIGGGLLLSQLMRGNGANSSEPTEEELNELYNYVYGGQ